MGLLDKRSLKLEGVQDFAWSPAAPLLCAYQAEGAGGNLPARVSLIRIPDRVELRQKNLFSVSGAPLLGCRRAIACVAGALVPFACMRIPPFEQRVPGCTQPPEDLGLVQGERLWHQNRVWSC